MAASTAHCALILVLVYCPTPLRWHRKRRPRRPACTFGDSLIVKILVLDSSSTLSVSFHFLLVRFTLKPRGLPLHAGIADDTRAVAPNTFMTFLTYLPFLYSFWIATHRRTPLPRRHLSKSTLHSRSARTMVASPLFSF